MLLLLLLQLSYFQGFSSTLDVLLCATLCTSGAKFFTLPTSTREFFSETPEKQSRPILWQVNGKLQQCGICVMFSPLSLVLSLSLCISSWLYATARSFICRLECALFCFLYFLFFALPTHCRQSAPLVEVLLLITFLWIPFYFYIIGRLSKSATFKAFDGLFRLPG